MGKDHPYAWYHRFEGRLGHIEEVVRSEDYKKHLIGGIRWAAGLEESTSSKLSANKATYWWSDRHQLRIPITIGAKGYTRFDVPAEVKIDFKEGVYDVIRD